MIELKHNSRTKVRNIIVIAIKLSEEEVARFPNRCKICACSQHSVSNLQCYCIGLDGRRLYQHLHCNTMTGKFIVCTKETYRKTLKLLKETK